jgi:hypothetical protein
MRVGNCGYEGMGGGKGGGSAGGLLVGGGMRGR